MKEIFAKLIVFVGFIAGGFVLTDKGCHSASGQELENYSRLCQSSRKTLGQYDLTYAQYSFKVLRSSGKSHLNSLKYSYLVNGTLFRDSVLRSGLPKDLSLSIWYDPLNPRNHCTTDPCKQLAYEKDHKYPGWFSWIGIPLLLMGVGGLNGLYKSAVRNAGKALIPGPGSNL